MSDSADKTNTGQTSIQGRSAELHSFADHSMSREQARAAVRTDLETLQVLARPGGPKGHQRPTALATMGQIAGSQRSYGEALAEADPKVYGQAAAAAKSQSNDIGRAQAEYRQSPEGRAAAPQADRLREAVRAAEVEHDRQRAGRSYGELGPTASNRGPPASTPSRKGIEDRRGVA